MTHCMLDSFETNHYILSLISVNYAVYAAHRVIKFWLCVMQVG